MNQFMLAREDTRGPQEGTWLVEAIERAVAQLASLRFDQPEGDIPWTLPMRGYDRT